MVSRRFRALSGVALATASLLAIAACGSGFLDGLTGGSGDGGSEATAPGIPYNIGCLGAVPPDASTAPDGPSIAPIVLAFDALRLTANPDSDSGAPVPVGYNLDHLCTCPEKPACVVHDAGPSVQLPSSCDGANGADDALASFFSSLGAAIPEFKDDFATDRIASGIFTIILEVFNWNGQPEDPTVTVRMRMSTGMDREATGRKKPFFDGTDVWQVDPDSIIQGQQNIGGDCRTATEGMCTPTIADSAAFVTGGKLIAHVRNSDGRTPLVLQSTVGRVSIDLRSTTLAGTLTQDGAGLWHMKGELSGRWPVESILNTIANIENPFDSNKASVCESAAQPSSLYSTFKKNVCIGLDISADPARDTNPTTVCDAVSGALSFSASTATAGHIVARTPLSTNCVDWKDDCTR